jgi:hypothetical protein
VDLIHRYCINRKTWHFAHVVYSSVLYDSCNKELLFL